MHVLICVTLLSNVLYHYFSCIRKKAGFVVVNKIENGKDVNKKNDVKSDERKISNGNEMAIEEESSDELLRMNMKKAIFVANVIL